MTLKLQIPPPGVPFLNPDGTVAQIWLNFLNTLVSRAGGITGGLQPGSVNLDSLSGLDGTPGILAQTGVASFTKRTLKGTAGRTAVTNGSGAAGDPTVDLAAVSGVAGVHASPTSITVDGYGRITGIS